ncbi:hypothetical protein HDU87_006486 [Geranomyces variabilis]|uniref:Uncharacterized protein n=1 Tax=Geranomyces variabilis TaxID=109894 RepID=A0AAD5TFA9_9FUNG|nr:hypothetical protein HDU87_006486 [Geranomyces variabilis]
MSSSSALPSTDVLARRARRAELQASRNQALTAAHAVLTDEDRRRALVKAFCELNGGYASSGGDGGDGNGSGSGVRNSVILPASGTPYVIDGVDVANRALQTSDGEFESFEDVARICAEFRKELRIVFRMLESNQTRAIRLSTDSLYSSTRARLAALESLHQAQLTSARRTCRQQFRTAVRELLRSQREYNSSSVRELEAALEPELRASEAAVRKSEKELRYAVDEEERLAFQNARVGLVMLKKGLFSANEAPAIEAIAAKAIDTVVLYQSSLSKLDDEIFNLRGRISELSEHFDEAAEELDVLNNPTVRSRPITQGGASSSTRRGSVMSARTGRGGTAGAGGGGGAGSAGDSAATSRRASSASVAAGTERHTRESTAPGNRDGAGGGVGGGRSGSGAPRGGGHSEDEAEAAPQQRPLSPYSFLSEEEREKLDAHRAHYEAMVRELHETQAQEHRNATTARLSHLAQWTRQILSLSALGEPPTLRKITARQLALLQLALKHSKPRPCVNTGTTAYSSGLTIVMLEEEQRRESIRLAEEEQKRIERLEESKRKAAEKRQRELEEEEQQRIAAAKAAALALEAVQQSTSTLQQVASTPRLMTTAPASRRKRRPSADGGGNARARYQRIARGLALRGAGDEPEKLRDPSFGKREAVLGVHLDAGAEAAEYTTVGSGSASGSRRQQPGTDAGAADTKDAAPPVPPPSPVPKPERLAPPPTPPSSPPLQPQRHKARVGPQPIGRPQTRYVASIPGPRRAVLPPAAAAAATAATKTSLVPAAASPQSSLQPIPSVVPLQPTPQAPSDTSSLAITATSSALPRRIALAHHHHPHHYNLTSYHRPAAAPPPPPAPLQPRADVVVSYVEAAAARARTIKARIPVPLLTDEEGLMIESMTIRPWSAISDGGRGW